MEVNGTEGRGEGRGGVAGIGGGGDPQGKTPIELVQRVGTSGESRQSQSYGAPHPVREPNGRDGRGEGRGGGEVSWAHGGGAESRGTGSFGKHVFFGRGAWAARSWRPYSLTPPVAPLASSLPRLPPRVAPLASPPPRRLSRVASPASSLPRRLPLPFPAHLFLLSSPRAAGGGCGRPLRRRGVVARVVGAGSPDGPCEPVRARPPRGSLDAAPPRDGRRRACVAAAARVAGHARLAFGGLLAQLPDGRRG